MTPLSNTTKAARAAETPKGGYPDPLELYGAEDLQPFTSECNLQLIDPKEYPASAKYFEEPKGIDFQVRGRHNTTYLPKPKERAVRSFLAPAEVKGRGVEKNPSTEKRSVRLTPEEVDIRAELGRAREAAKSDLYLSDVRSEGPQQPDPQTNRKGPGYRTEEKITLPVPQSLVPELDQRSVKPRTPLPSGRLTSRTSEAASTAKKAIPRVILINKEAKSGNGKKRFTLKFPASVVQGTRTQSTSPPPEAPRDPKPAGTAGQKRKATDTPTATVAKKQREIASPLSRSAAAAENEHTATDVPAPVGRFNSIVALSRGEDSADDSPPGSVHTGWQPRNSTNFLNVYAEGNLGFFGLTKDVYFGDDTQCPPGKYPRPSGPRSANEVPSTTWIFWTILANTPGHELPLNVVHKTALEWISAFQPQEQSVRAGLSRAKEFVSREKKWRLANLGEVVAKRPGGVKAKSKAAGESEDVDNVDMS